MVLIAGTGATAALSLAYSVYVARTLGPEAFADYAAAISFVFICSVATGLINPTVARFAAEYHSRAEHGKILALATEVSKRVSLYGVAGIIVAVLVLRPLARFFQFQSDLTLLVAFGIAYLNLLLSVVRGLLRGVQHFGQLSGNNILEGALRLSIGVALLHVAANATLGLAGYALAIVVVLLVSPLQLRRLWRGCEPQKLDGAAVRRFTGPILLLTAATVGFQNFDMLFAKRLFTDTDASLYGAAATLARMVSVLVTPFTTLMLPLMTSLYEQRRGTTQTFLRVCGYFLLLVSIPLVVFCLWPEWIMVRAYTAAFAGAGGVLRCLSLARLLGYLAHMICLLLAARSSFQFLYIYLPGLGMMILGLSIWNASPLAMSVAVLVVQGVTLVAITMYLWTQRAGRTRQQLSLGQTPQSR